jgi:hypothetical protein
MDERNENRIETTATPSRVTLHEIASSAIRYWEPRRLLYNLMLGMIVVGYWNANWPKSREAVTFDGVLRMFLLAVLANVCYCAAYPVDVFAQFSDLRPLWLRWRWLVLAVGLAFAAILTRFFAMEFFVGGMVG